MAQDECTLENVTVMKANRTGAAISLGVSALALLAVILVLAIGGFPNLPARPPPGAADVGAFLRVMFLTMCGGIFGAWYFTRLSRKPSSLVGSLRATRNGIYVEGKRLVARDQIKTAYVCPTPHGTFFVRIERGSLSGPLDLKVADLEQGRALVHALGLDASQTTARYALAATSRPQLRRRMLTGFLGGTTGFIGGIASLIGHAALGPVFSIVLAVFFFSLYLVSIAGYLKSGAVTVGADGILVKWLWTKRFIPIAEIVSAEVVDGEPNRMRYIPILVRVTLRSGERVELVAAVMRAGFGGAPVMMFTQLIHMRASIIAERINEAIAGAGKGASSALANGASWDPALLARGTRAVAEWVASLHAMQTKTETFREPGWLLEHLWSTVEDATKTASDRVAAAVALAPHIDDDGRQRLRLAAQAAVVPKLRVALEAAASDDDDKLVSVLDEVSA